MTNEFLKSVTELLKTTEDNFTKAVLCHIGYDDINHKEVPYFCAVGECIHAVGYSCQQLKSSSTLHDFNKDNDNGDNMYINMQTKLIERFHVDFTQHYQEPIECYFCIQDDIIPTKLRSFESVINHINDSHTYGGKNAFGKIAEKLEQIAKYYDLQTGEYIYGNTNTGTK